MLDLVMTLSMAVKEMIGSSVMMAMTHLMVEMAEIRLMAVAGLIHWTVAPGTMFMFTIQTQMDRLIPFMILASQIMTAYLQQKTM